MSSSDKITIRFSEMVLIAVLLVYLTAVSNVYSFPSLRDASWPADMTSPFFYRTPSPIDISSCDVRVVNTTSPFKVVISQNIPYEIINTGCSLKVVNSCPELIYGTGSIFGNDKYLFEYVEFFWTKTHTGAAGPKIDGVGSPIFVANYLRNSKYDNKTAKFHRDGYMVSYFNVYVEGKTSNPVFTEFGKLLSCLSKPGSNHQTFTPIFYVWYDQWFKTSHFYAYPGSIGQYDCATVIWGPRSSGTSISLSQFQVFQNIRDSTGTPINRVSPTYPVNGRPIVEVYGVHQTFPLI